MTRDKPTVLQLHWQHREYLCRTIFVEQSPPLRSMQEATAWVESLARHAADIPPDHDALVCDRGCEHFDPFV